MMGRIARSIHRIVYYACIVGMVVILLMMLLTTSDVIGRSIFTWPIPGTLEITSYMLAVIILLGMGHAQQARQYVRVDLFIIKIPRRGQVVLESIFTLFALIVFALVAWQGWEGGFKALRQNETSDILRIPSYPFELLVAVGAFLLCLELILTIIDIWKRPEKNAEGNIN